MGMTSLILIGAVVLIVAFAALTGAKPDDARSIRHTRLMAVGKIILLITVLAVAVGFFVSRGL